MRVFLFVFVILVALAFAAPAAKKAKKPKKKAKEDVISDDELRQLYPEAFSEDFVLKAAERQYQRDYDDYYAARVSAAYNSDDSRAPAKKEDSYIDLPPMMARITLKRTIFDGKTDLQTAKVVEAPFFGKILILDGDLMLTERDEFHYHEMMAHVPLAYIPKASRVLIIGGGDGGLALQVLQHPSVKNVTLVEIDKGVVDLCKKYLPSTARSFQSKRMHLVIDDGAKYVKNMCDNGMEKFDVVIVDSTDAGPAFPLATQEFYDNVRKCALKEPGIFVFNMQSASWGTENLGARARNVSALYKNAFVYQVFQPTYASGHYALMFASDHIHPFKTPIDWAAVDAQGALPYRYWTPDIHYASFILPNFVSKQVYKDSDAKNGNPEPLSLSMITTPYHWKGSQAEKTIAEQTVMYKKIREEALKLQNAVDPQKDPKQEL